MLLRIHMNEQRSAIDILCDDRHRRRTRGYASFLQPRALRRLSEVELSCYSLHIVCVQRGTWKFKLGHFEGVKIGKASLPQYLSCTRKKICYSNLCTYTTGSPLSCSINTKLNRGKSIDNVDEGIKVTVLLRSVTCRLCHERPLLAPPLNQLSTAFELYDHCGFLCLLLFSYLEVLISNYYAC